MNSDSIYEIYGWNARAQIPLELLNDAQRKIVEAARAADPHLYFIEADFSNEEAKQLMGHLASDFGINMVGGTFGPRAFAAALSKGKHEFKRFKELFDIDIHYCIGKYHLVYINILNLQAALYLLKLINKDGSLKDRAIIYLSYLIEYWPRNFAMKAEGYFEFKSPISTFTRAFHLHNNDIIINERALTIEELSVEPHINESMLIALGHGHLISNPATFRTQKMYIMGPNSFNYYCEFFERVNSAAWHIFANGPWSLPIHLQPVIVTPKLIWLISDEDERKAVLRSIYKKMAPNRAFGCIHDTDDLEFLINALPTWPNINSGLKSSGECQMPHYILDCLDVGDHQMYLNYYYENESKLRGTLFFVTKKK